MRISAKHLVIVLAAATALAGCSKSEETAAGKAPKMKPGEYESTSEIVKFEAPGMSAAMSAKLQETMVGTKTTAKHCLTKEQADKDQGDMFKNIAAGGGNCAMDSYKVNGGKVAGQMTCTTPSGGKGVMTLAGSVSDSASDMTMVANIEDKTLPQGKATMEMKVATKRLGDCTSEAATKS
jgi:Protein of unknown function (DUF3617)